MARVTAQEADATTRILRAGQWLHFLPIVLLPLAPRDAARAATVGLTVLAIAAAAGALGFAYGVNALADRHTDRSVEKNPLASTADDPALRLRLVPWVSAGVAWVSAAGHSARALAAVTLSLAAGWLYSCGPRWKAHPIIGLVANTAIFVPLACLIEPTDVRSFVVNLGVFVVLLVQNQLVHELADQDEDEDAGDLTTARFLGERATKVVCALLSALGIGAIASSGLSATSRGVGAATLTAGCAVALFTEPAAKARLRHRSTSVAGGALLYLSGWLR